VSFEAKVLILAFVPSAYLVIVRLMLKEHQYINMRDRYLGVVVRPAFERLAGHRFSWWGWNEFEGKQMGRRSGLPGRWQRLMTFSFLDPFDYAIPFLIVGLSLLGYYLS